MEMHSIKEILEHPEAGKDPRANAELKEALGHITEVMQVNLANPQMLSCPKCEGTGWMIVDDERFRCLCRLEAIVQYALPRLYHAARFEHFSEAVRSAVMDWLNHPTGGMFLTGPTGTGKTYLAASIVRRRIEYGKKATFRRAAQLFQSIRDSYNSKSAQTEESILDDYISTPLLVLDDLGAGSLSDHERRCTLEVIDRRMNDMRPTIVTSNLDVDQIAQHMDERIGSRLSTFTKLAFGGQDKRTGR